MTIEDALLTYELLDFLIDFVFGLHIALACVWSYLIGRRHATDEIFASSDEVREE